MPFFRPRVWKINMKTLYRPIRYKIGYKAGRFCADYSDIFQSPSADSVHCVSVIFTRPFDTQEISFRVTLCLVEQECPSACADLDMNRAFTSENPDKIDFTVQTFGF